MNNNIIANKLRKYLLIAEKIFSRSKKIDTAIAKSNEIHLLELHEKVLTRQLQIEKYRYNYLVFSSNLVKKHGKNLALTLLGKEDSVVEVEVPTIEIISEKDGFQATFEGQSLTQVKDYIYESIGIKFESEDDIKNFLVSKDAEHLIAQTPRRVISDYIPTENLEEVYDILGNFTEKLWGEDIG